MVKVKIQPGHYDSHTAFQTSCSIVLLSIWCQVWDPWSSLTNNILSQEEHQKGWCAGQSSLHFPLTASVDWLQYKDHPTHPGLSESICPLSPFPTLQPPPSLPSILPPGLPFRAGFAEGVVSDPLSLRMMSSLRGKYFSGLCRVLGSFGFSYFHLLMLDLCILLASCNGKCASYCGLLKGILVEHSLWIWKSIR